jgi:RNA polymerase sigma-70 factor (ECF subfamily)
MNLSEKSDETLVKETLQGFLSSYEILVKKYQQPIKRHANRYLDSDDAEDATQETFIRAFKNLNHFDQKKLFKPWLYQIATNYCLDELRKNKKITALPEEIISDEKPVVEKIMEEEETKIIRKAVDKLPDKYKLPIRGYYFDNHSYENLAKILKLPLNTIRTRLSRGKKLLEQALREKKWIK